MINVCRLKTILIGCYIAIKDVRHAQLLKETGIFLLIYVWIEVKRRSIIVVCIGRLSGESTADPSGLERPSTQMRSLPSYFRRPLRDEAIGLF
jgi:hypothetical protein